MNLLKLFILMIFIVIAFLATGCSTVVPVAVKFPSAPAELLVDCEELEKVPADTKQLSVTSETVVRNYGRYHKCRAKVNAWQEWHNSQKQIFESVK
jgi:hypothetical protein